MKKFDIYYREAVDLLKQLLAIPSFSRDEKAAADLLEAFLKKKNRSPSRKGNNVWARSANWDDARPTILLNSHIDTVKPVAGWTRDPFAATEEGDRLYGLGSNDAGASLVSLLAAFLHLCGLDAQSPAPHSNYIFLASCEEEVSGKGGIESVLPDLPPIAVAVVGEPTGMRPAIAERGLMVLDGVVHGKAGHAARDDGENAIYKALPVIEWFSRLRFPKESTLLGGVKATVTMIDAGTQHNVIPDECRFTVDVRTNELYTNEQIFNEIAAQCGCHLSARSFRLNSSSIDPNHYVVQRAKQMGLEPYGSPTLSDQALMPFPSVKIGPGASERSHTADEFVLLSEIRQAVEVYVGLIA
ncbi:acetylornithine deacetylase [Bacteroidia bacterium]|nr:acetylornithine deacetylase [Bacteroidia bacterium]